MTTKSSKSTVKFPTNDEWMRHGNKGWGFYWEITVKKAHTDLLSIYLPSHR